MVLARPAAAVLAPRAVARWLIVVVVMVYAMVVVGGITRLTESGLSMTRWEPIAGIVPPIGDAQWQAEFAAYKATPEYRDVNRGMGLDGFKRIFFWEYLHRAIGRLIGFVFALPLLWFWWRRAIPPGYASRLVALLALGGLQGAIGWWMVASGLVDRPDVSHIRLAVHLLNALLILGGCLWTALDLFALDADPSARSASFPALGAAALALLAIQLTLGAFTAGLDAGYAFPSWPLMGDRLFPERGWHAGWSAARNAIDNPIVVQFVHRWFAFVVLIAVILLARAAKRAGRRRNSTALHAVVGTQILLGISTLMSGVALPIAVAHQATAVLLLIAIVAAAHTIADRYHGTSSQMPAFA